jgi:hypothetical protein
MDVVYATTNAVVPLPGGGQHVVRAGTHWPADDPIVKAQPSLFSSDPAYGLNYSARPEVEQVTAAPGERRAVRRVKD